VFIVLMVQPMDDCAAVWIANYSVSNAWFVSFVYSFGLAR